MTVKRIPLYANVRTITEERDAKSGTPASQILVSTMPLAIPKETRFSAHARRVLRGQDVRPTRDLAPQSHASTMEFVATKATVSSANARQVTEETGARRISTLAR